MSSLVRHHLNNYAREYRSNAAVGNWDRATDEQFANALYAEGFAWEHQGNLRLASACYELAVLLTGHRKAKRRLDPS